MKVAVVFWTGGGNTEAMANAVADGAKGKGTDVDVIFAGDFSADKIADYAGIAFGCPSMGSEVLEESEFQPMWDDVKGNLNGKKVALFGSYGWGDGEWMRNWESECDDLGVQLCYDCVIANEAPDDDAIAECNALGAAVAS